MSRVRSHEVPRLSRSGETRPSLGLPMPARCLYTYHQKEKCSTTRVGCWSSGAIWPYFNVDRQLRTLPGRSSCCREITLEDIDYLDAQIPDGILQTPISAVRLNPLRHQLRG
jgi:hypothetical protein